jgi:predicted Rossmann fold nucleotide-binding protein DprA/Smf involved in DNA uptake
MLLMDLFWGIWIPPTPTRSIRYRIGGNNKYKAAPVYAKVKIMSVLTDEWKSNKQISAETGLQLNTVQQKTAKLHVAGKIDKITRKEDPDTKPVCLYRKKNDTIRTTC